MTYRKYMIKLNNKLESTWRFIALSGPQPSLQAGWYICEFVLPGMINHTPRFVIESDQGKVSDRYLVGHHAGRNRMLIYLPDGTLTAYSQSLDIIRLVRVSNMEGRARILLISARYLRDFFRFSALLKVVFMQFQDRVELSNSLLSLYEPASGTDSYLHDINRWQKFRGFRRWLNWLGRGVRVGVVIESESQRAALDDLLVPPDAVILAGQAIPSAVDYVIPLAATETLRDPAVLMLKRAIKRAGRGSSQRPTLVYTDHDYVDDPDQDPLHPVFKPQASQAYLHCFNYPGFALACHVNLLTGLDTARLLEVDTQYALALSAFRDTQRVLHVPEALFTSRRRTQLDTPAPLSTASAWPHIDWQRVDTYNVLRANEAWQDHPSVDLVIPTRDGLAVLKPCIESILQKTTYTNYNIIIVDNGSEKPETLAFFDAIQKDERVRVVAYPGEFNYSAINNFAVAQGAGEYIGLINNDIEVIDGDWLTQMMVWAIQDNVGIVGAKLLFGNGKVQHAGVTIGMGNAAGHIHRLEAGDAPGYQLRCLATQNMMAVTAACLITPRKVFEGLNGLDEVTFRVAYNDIDYCLRVESQGYQVIWTPEACLYHHESVSRGDDFSDQHLARYMKELAALQKRWKCKGFVDKYYSKHLRISDEGVYPQIERSAPDQLIYLQRGD